MTRLRPCGGRAWLAAVLVVGVIAAGCTTDEPPDPETALVQTVDETLAGSFSYRLVAEADREALDDLGQSLGSVAARLNLFEVSGVVDGATVSVDLQVFGTRPLLQLRRYGAEELFVRIGTDGPLAALATPEVEGRLLGVAVQTSQPDAVVAAIGALFDGEWVQIAGAFDPAALTGLPEGDDGEPASLELPTPLPQIVADYLTVVDQESGTATTTRVDLRVRDLLRALASLCQDGFDVAAFEEGLALLPEAVTGEVLTRDGLVEAFVFDVAEAAREAGGDVSGALELRFELSDHGDPDAPEVPQAAVTVPSADLAEGLAQLQAIPDGLQPSPSPARTSIRPARTPTRRAPTADIPSRHAA